MQVHMSKKKEKAVVLSKNQLELFGDVDVLFKLNLHHVSRDLFNEVLPQDVQSRMPSKYLNRLK